MNTISINRCEWVTKDPIYIDYHDNEWGKPVRDNLKLFEFLILESFQAGLSWLTILKRRQGFSDAFDQFDYHKIAKYDSQKVNQLLDNKEIIRNRNKIESSISNARAYIHLLEEFSTFDHYLTTFLGDKPIIGHYESLKDLPAKTSISDSISKDLKKRGFRFFGSTTVYAFLQATGYVIDHTKNCYLYQSNIKL